MADLHTKERTLEKEIAPAVERAVPGVEVLALELLSPSRFCVYVDHPRGVDHELCVRVTQLLDAYRTEYGIDVSSPGPERPLRKPQHFRGALGRPVTVRTAQPVGGKTKFRGEVVDADERVFTLATPDGRQLEIPYEQIVRGNLIDEA